MRRGFEAGEGLNAGALELDAGGSGIVQNTPSAWLWSGEIEAGDSREIVVSYRIARVRGVEYRVNSGSRMPIKAHRVKNGEPTHAVETAGDVRGRVPFGMSNV